MGNDHLGEELSFHSDRTRREVGPEGHHNLAEGSQRVDHHYQGDSKREDHSVEEVNEISSYNHHNHEVTALEGGQAGSHGILWERVVA